MEQDIEQLVRDSITTILEEVGADASSLSSFELSRPKDPKFGDYTTNVAMRLSGIAGTSPVELAERIKSQIIADGKLEQFRVEVVRPGYINLFVKEENSVDRLEAILKAGDSFGSSTTGNGKTALIEYFQLNVAKPPHVGHLRSAIIGDAIKRIFISQGYKTLSDTHVGDWGTQFGIMIAAYKKYGDRTVVEKDPLNELEKLYVQYNKDIEQEPALREVGKQEFAKLEQGDKENRELWQWFVDVSMQKLHGMSKLLGLLPFELHMGESFYEPSMPAIVEESLQKKVAQKGGDGSIFVDLESDKLDQAYLIKSDGATTYLLRDLAKLKYVGEKYPDALNIYIVDVRQSHHFRQLFRVAELLGWKNIETSAHVDFGFLKLPEGAMSTRRGNVIALEKVITEACDRSLKIIKEKNPELPNKEEVARQVGLAALKYFDLSHNRASDITFSWDQAISFEGNTGPYLQYTHARIHGILRKVRQSTGDIASTSPSDTEVRIIRLLEQFPDAVSDSMHMYLPNLICNYLFGMAQEFNAFYEKSPVLGETDPSKQQLRLHICRATAQVLKNGLDLLGIQAPERM